MCRQTSKKQTSSSQAPSPRPVVDDDPDANDENDDNKRARLVVPRLLTAQSTKQQETHDPSLPLGLKIYYDFLTREEEVVLIAKLDASKRLKPSSRSGVCYSCNFGCTIDYAAKRTRAPPHEETDGIPEWLRFVIARFNTKPSLSCWFPNQCNANDYRPGEGHYLKPHYDDRVWGGEIIVNINCLGDAVMEFNVPNTQISKRVMLPRLSASVMAKDARWGYTHEIKNEDFLGCDRRVSFNFRQLVM